MKKRERGLTPCYFRTTLTPYLRVQRRLWLDGVRRGKRGREAWSKVIGEATISACDTVISYEEGEYQVRNKMKARNRTWKTLFKSRKNDEQGKQE